MSLNNICTWSKMNYDSQFQIWNKECGFTNIVILAKCTYCCVDGLCGSRGSGDYGPLVGNLFLEEIWVCQMKDNVLHKIKKVELPNNIDEQIKITLIEDMLRHDKTIIREREECGRNGRIWQVILSKYKPLSNYIIEPDDDEESEDETYTDW